MLIPTLIAALVSLCVFLLLQHFRLRSEVKKLTRTTREIRSGNLNLRYRLRTNRQELEELGGELNRLVDYFQNAYERTGYLEEERKRMIANISHDLRTPLTSLLGYMEALQHDAALTPEEREAFLRIAAGKGSSLLELLQEFFELAKLESDDSIPELRRVNLTELIPDIALGLYPEFVKAEITPVIEIPDTPLFVMGDAACLQRILNNLLSNALRYGRDGKVIGIGLREEADAVWIDVWDRGKGIAAQDLPRVFERLYTGEASRNASLRGTGLGLTIAKNLVEKQGGRITVSSKPNEKTVFSFSLAKG